MPSKEKFKVIDDIFNDIENEHYTSKIGSYPIYPPERPQVMPLNHLMKSNQNPKRFQEIFGNYQNFSHMEEKNFDTVKKYVNHERIPEERPYHSTPVKMEQYPLDNIPRVKFFEDVPMNSRPGNYKRKIYEAISNYFQGFTMTKVDVIGQYAIFKALIGSLISVGARFIVAIVKNNSSLPIGSKMPLIALEWVSFQTRNLEDDSEIAKFQLQPFHYSKPIGTILEDTIRISRQTSKSNIYLCDNLPLTVEILKDKADEILAETATVSMALEVFNTVLSWNN